MGAGVALELEAFEDFRRQEGGLAALEGPEAVRSFGISAELLSLAFFFVLSYGSGCRISCIPTWLLNVNMDGET